MLKALSDTGSIARNCNDLHFSAVLLQPVSLSSLHVFLNKDVLRIGVYLPEGKKNSGSKNRKGFSFNFYVDKRKVIIHCDQTVFKSLRV